MVINPLIGVNIYNYIYPLHPLRPKPICHTPCSYQVTMAHAVSVCSKIGGYDKILTFFHGEKMFFLVGIFQCHPAIPHRSLKNWDAHPEYPKGYPRISRYSPRIFPQFSHIKSDNGPIYYWVYLMFYQATLAMRIVEFAATALARWSIERAGRSTPFGSVKVLRGFSRSWWQAENGEM